MKLYCFDDTLRSVDDLSRVYINTLSIEEIIIIIINNNNNNNNNLIIIEEEEKESD